MPQFFVNPSQISLPAFDITDDEAAHILRAARLRSGDEITVFDGRGRRALAVIESAERDSLRCRVIRPLPSPEPPVSIQLCFAVVSRPAVEEIIDSCTQLGVHSFQPVLTKRCERGFAARWDSKSERLGMIALSACKQSMRGRVPDLLPPAEFSALLASSVPSLIAWEKDGANSVRKAMESLASVESPRPLRVFVGPEGGFEEGEIASALSAGFLPVTLGQYILRAQTACACAVSQILS